MFRSIWRMMLSWNGTGNSSLSTASLELGVHLVDLTVPSAGGGEAFWANGSGFGGSVYPPVLSANYTFHRWVSLPSTAVLTAGDKYQFLIYTSGSCDVQVYRGSSSATCGVHFDSGSISSRLLELRLLQIK